MSLGATSSNERPGASDGIRVREVVREVVAEVAAEELPVVDGLTRFDDATVVRRLTRPRRREPLGFGLAEVASLVTPVVWLALDQAAHRAAGCAVDGATKGVKAVIGKVFRGKSRPVTIPALTPEQLGEVRRAVMETSARRGLDGPRAETVADAVVTRLALAARGPAQEPDGPDGDDAPGEG